MWGKILCFATIPVNEFLKIWCEIFYFILRHCSNTEVWIKVSIIGKRSCCDIPFRVTAHLQIFQVREPRLFEFLSTRVYTCRVSKRTQVRMHLRSMQVNLLGCLHEMAHSSSWITRKEGSLLTMASSLWSPWSHHIEKYWQQPFTSFFKTT